MDIERYGSNSRLSKVVKANGFAFLSGLTARDTAVGVEEQTADILQQIDELLAMAGSDKAGIVNVNIWMRDIAQRDRMNAVWEAWVDPQAKPARATVQSALGREDVLLEIMVQALA